MYSFMTKGGFILSVICLGGAIIMFFGFRIYELVRYHISKNKSKNRKETSIIIQHTGSRLQEKTEELDEENESKE